MAWAGGTQVITAQNGCLKIVTTKFDADAEFATAIDLAAQIKAFFPNGVFPTGRACALHAVRTLGATDTVAISLQGSLDGGTTYRDVVDITKTTGAATADTAASCAYDNDMLYATLEYARIFCTTVGAGNTLTATAWIRVEAA